MAIQRLLLNLFLAFQLFALPPAATAFYKPVSSSSSAPTRNSPSEAHPPSHGSSFALEYTGALFGYYRQDEAHKSPEDRTKIVPSTQLPAVHQFLEKRNYDSPLLLGMGDNFAPEFGAAIQFEGIDACEQKGSGALVMPKKNLYGRDQSPALFYKTDYWGAPHAHCDNVANFLLKAGYRAIVPGKEDFLYSADWLQSLWLNLLDPSEKSQTNYGGHLSLLAANLRLGNGKDGPCPLLFSKSALPAANPVSGGVRNSNTKSNPKTQCVLSDGEAVPIEQDWVERLDITLRQKSYVPNQINDVDNEINKAAAGSAYERRQLLINQTSMMLAAITDTITSLLDPGSKTRMLNDIVAIQPLATDAGYEVSEEQVTVRPDCSSAMGRLRDEINKYSASPSDAYRDVGTAVDGLAQVFDQLRLTKGRLAQSQAILLLPKDVREAIRDLLLRHIAEEELDSGYTFADRQLVDNNVERVLLIGVVGRETMDAVSPNNLSIDDKKVRVLDPRRTSAILLRAARLKSHDDRIPIDKTIIMAQMPKTEAEEMGAHLRADFADKLEASKDFFPVDLILSEAQEEHASPSFATSYRGEELIPVLAPHPAFNRRAGALIEPVSEARIEMEARGDRRLVNHPRQAFMQSKGPMTTVELFNAELKHLSPRPDDLTASTTIDFLLRELQVSTKADVVMLERRDFYLDRLPLEYAGYDDYCDNGNYLCRRRVALDRILWKGDYSESVMVSGKDLKQVLQAAEDQYIAQQSLAARDTTDQWLVTLGVVTSDETHLTRLEVNSDHFGIPWSDECHKEKLSLKQDQEGEPQYCVNGSTIADDAAYWIATSDHIANDTVIYKALQAEPRNYHRAEPSKLVYVDAATHQPVPRPDDYLFLTDDLNKNLGGKGAPMAAAFVKESETTVGGSPTLQHLQQDRSLLHLDYSKLVAGFNLRHPDGGNSAAAGFQGVTDTRASQPTQQGLDLESANRFSADLTKQSFQDDNPKDQPIEHRSTGFWHTLSLGAQSDAEYDRSVQGNLTNKPINASYAVNNFTVGGFIQKRIPFWRDSKTTGDNWASRELPRTLIVLYPYQYQRQITGNFVFLNYTAGNGELTLHAPIVTGHAYKAGLRRELAGGRQWAFDRGSYAESGWEYVVQNNLTRSLTLYTASTGASHTCYATNKQTLSECFSGFTIDPTTTAINPDRVSQTTTGFYWDIHLQRSIPRGSDPTKSTVSLSIDTKGDFFGGRQSSLATQTRYAFPVSGVINFPVLRNLSFSPTYSAFLFQNQVSQQSILVSTFSVSAKWFFDRESEVPFPRMFLFKGPPSQDQTKTAKMK